MKESDLENKSSKEIVDGLVSKYDGDEELALRELKDYLSKKEDGYLDRNSEINKAKDQLEKMVESKTIFKLKEHTSNFGKAVANIVNDHLNTYKTLMEKKDKTIDHSIELYTGNPNVPNMILLLQNGIHPNCLYSHIPFRYIDNDGNKHVIQLSGINIDNDTVSYRELSYDRHQETGEPFLKRSEPKEMSLAEFQKITENELNTIWADKYKLHMTPERANKLITAIQQKDQNNIDASKSHFELYKELLSDYDLRTQRLIYNYIQNGTELSIPEIIKKLEAEGKIKPIKNESVLEEDTIKRNQPHVQEVLKDFIPENASTISINGFVLPGNGITTKDEKFDIDEIVGYTDPSSLATALAYVTERGDRKQQQEWPLPKLLKVLDAETNKTQDLPDIWELAASPKGWQKHVHSGSTGTYENLSSEEINELLKYVQENDPLYKDVNFKYTPGEKLGPEARNAIKTNANVYVRNFSNGPKVFVPKDGKTQADRPRTPRSNTFNNLMKGHK